MKHTFSPHPSGNFLRKVDSVRGNLLDYADSTEIHPPSASVNPADFEVYSAVVPVVPVPLPVPFSLVAWQAKAALAMTPHPQSGNALVATLEAINAMPDGPDKIVVLSAWDNNANFERTSLTILSFGAAIGMSQDALDDLFRLGGGLSL